MERVLRDGSDERDRRDGRDNFGGTNRRSLRTTASLGSAGLSLMSLESLWSLTTLPQTPRTVTAPLFSTAVSATLFRVAAIARLVCCRLTAEQPRLPRKEPASGRTVSRRKSGRGTGVDRVTSQARNVGMRLWTVLMYSSPVPEARQPHPQTDGTAGHARTRSEAVATPEAAHVLGRSGGGIQASAAHSTDADLRMSGRGWICIRPCRAPDANTHRL